jgi:flagellar hook-length control protein FliK
VRAIQAETKQGSASKDPSAAPIEGPLEDESGAIELSPELLDPAIASDAKTATASLSKLGSAAGKGISPLFGGGSARTPDARAVDSGSVGQVGQQPTAGIPAALTANSSVPLAEPTDITSDPSKPATTSRIAGADNEKPAPNGQVGIEVPGKTQVQGKDATLSLPPVPEPQPEARFAEANHARMLNGIRGELMPNGGSMQLRLDPPALGDLVISVQMRDGVMTAAFQTTNDDATRMLSHSLGDLKAMLEAQGVTVEKLQVQQAPKQDASQNQQGDGSHRQASQEEQQNSRREQQRKDMVQKLWDKLTGRGPVDVKA